MNGSHIPRRRRREAVGYEGCRDRGHDGAQLAHDHVRQRQAPGVRHLRVGEDRGRHEVSRKLCGFPSRRWTAFFLGVLIGTVVVGCSMFGPGLGVSVY